MCEGHQRQAPHPARLSLRYPSKAYDGEERADTLSQGREVPGAPDLTDRANGTRKAKQSASPYSTGNGGGTFEHKLGALLLARLLTSSPVTALDERAPDRVAFQQAPRATADDYVLEALAADGTTTIRLDLAVRRRPKFITSHVTTGELVTALVKGDLAAENGRDTKVEGTVDHRLAVAVSGPQNHAQQLAELADLARGQTSSGAFEALIRTPGKFTLAPRLDHLTALVDAALTTLAAGDQTLAGPNAKTAKERTWRLLRRLHIWQVNLETGHEDDWTRLIADLKPVAKDWTQEHATALRDRLTQLSAQLAQTAGDLNKVGLRRRLHGHLHTTAAATSTGWTRLTALDSQARSSVRRTLATGTDSQLLLSRTDERSRLTAALAAGGDLLVIGDSGVGKSALVLDATGDVVLGENTQAVAVHLRHLPDTPAELLAVFNSSIEDLLHQLTAPQRLLVIDGAEAAAEAHGDVLRTLARAARTSGTRLVVITASEGATAARKLLRAEGSTPIEHHIDGLNDDEIATVAAAFTALERLAHNERGRQLLRRPIIVDLLISADDPGLPLSDAQALEHIWKHLVRNQERRTDGLPDARAGVMLRLAEHAVRRGDNSRLPDSLDAAAVDGLRRSGVLQPVSDLPWERIPEFRHDLLRSYSIARLLLTNADPGTSLTDLGAPRWTLPAARLACEIALTAPDSPALRQAGRFAKLQKSFDALVAAGHGQRWSDIPTEALLTAPEPAPILVDAWPTLVADQAAGLERLLRILGARHKRDGLLDPAAATPVIKQLVTAGTPRPVGKQAAEMTTAYLQALVFAATQPGPVRAGLRSTIVKECAANQRRLVKQDAARAAELAARTPEQVAAAEAESKVFNVFGTSPMSGRRKRRSRAAHRAHEWITDEQIQHLGLLGPDLGADGEAILRQIASDDPYKLQKVVETAFAGNALGQYSTELLADLTAKYYIDERDDDSFGGYISAGDNGIRKHDYYGLGMPLANMLKGPFLALFRYDYRQGVTVLNRILDHAATFSSRITNEYQDPADSSAASRVVLSLAGEEREYAGDGQVWRWYRGTGTGPYPCMSALQALEFVTEEYIRAGASPVKLTEVMLADANNLAMPALALAVLVRHLEKVGSAADRFLVEPVIWHLEFGRATGGEHSGLAANIPDIPEPDRRRWSLREVSMRMAITADDYRAAELRAVGAQLEANAAADAGGDASAETARQLAAVRNWARGLDRDAYEITPHPEGFMIQQTSDASAEALLGPGNAVLQRINEAVGLTVRHAHVRDSGGRAPDIDAATLAADIVTAQALWEDPPDRTLAIDGPVAVAASAVELHLTGRTSVSDDDLLWSATVLLEVAAQVASQLAAAAEAGSDDLDDSFFSQGPDRSAARALPYLLLPSAAPLRAALGVESAADFEELMQLSRAVAADGASEAQVAYARGLDAVWAADCETNTLAGNCHHSLAMGLVTESFEHARLGPWDIATQRRSAEALDPPSTAGLAAVDDGDILVRRLSPALRALGEAAASTACCADDAYYMLDVLLDAHRRGMLAHDGYHHSHSDALIAARAALRQAATRGDNLITAHIAGLAGNAKVVSEALQAVAAAGEERHDLGQLAQQVWPRLMDIVLDAAATTQVLTEPTWGGYAAAALIPNPAASTWGYLTIELTGEAHPWSNPLEWTAHIERWLTTIPGSRMALEHLIIAVRGLDVTDQVRRGLPWIEQAVALAGSDCAGTFTLSEWLRERRTDLENDEQKASWLRVVDLLLVAGDTRVADLAD